jgi:uncharacterized membrane protein YqaE (UPF0057 family)
VYHKYAMVTSKIQLLCILNGKIYQTLQIDDKFTCNMIYQRLKDKDTNLKPINDYCFIDPNRGIISLTEQLTNLDVNCTNFLIITNKLKGGSPISKILNAAVGAVLNFLEKIIFAPLLKPIMPILKVLYTIFILVPIYVIKFTIWLVRFMLWFFIEVANPFKFINDFIGTTKMLTFTILHSIFQFFVILIKKFVNYFGLTVYNGFWGWDKVVVDEWDYKYSEYHNCRDACRGQKCYKTNNDKIPFSIIIGTVICPPIGVFMEYGITGWLNILVCILLTALFYFPGLIYALVVLYC